MEYSIGALKSKYKVIEFELDTLADVTTKASNDSILLDNHIITPRYGGCFANKAIYLPGEFDYEIVIDNEGLLCLLAIKK